MPILLCLTQCNLLTVHLNHSTSWYKPGQTPGSVLGEVSSSMEECRAETVALYRELDTKAIVRSFILCLNSRRRT